MLPGHIERARHALPVAAPRPQAGQKTARFQQAQSAAPPAPEKIARVNILICAFDAPSNGKAADEGSWTSHCWLIATASRVEFADPGCAESAGYPWV